MIDLNKVDISKLKQRVGNNLVIEQYYEAGNIIEDLTLTSPISIKLHLINIGQAIRVTGALKGVGLLQCSRCLESFSYKFKRNFKIDLCEEIRDYGGRLKRKDLEKSFYSGDNVNLIEEIRQQIILSLPMKPICKKDCLGLCNNCGVNLNNTTCNCSLENIDPRWAILKDAIIEKKGVFKSGKS